MRPTHHRDYANATSRALMSMKRLMVFSAFTVAVVLLGASASYAVTKTSAGTGNWSASGTWTPAGAPASGDDVIIGSGDTVTVDGTFTCLSLQVNSGANTTAVLTFAASGSPSLTVTGAITNGNAGNANQEGTITFASGSTLICGSIANGVVATQTSAINMTAGGTLRVGGAITTSGAGATWTPGTGTVELTATNTLPATIFTSFNNLTIVAGTTSLGVAITVSSTLQIDSGATLDESTRQMTMGTTSSVVVNGTLDFTSSTGNIRTGATGTVTLTMGSTGLIRTVDDNGLGPVANASLQINGTGVWTLTSINTNGTVEYNRNATSGQIVTDRDYNNLTITGSTQTKTWTIGATRTVNGTLTINTSAPLTLSGAQTVNVNGNWSNSGTFVAGTGTINFNGTTTISGSSTNSFNNLTITGILTAPAANMNVAGNWTNNGTFTPNGATITFNGASPQSVGASGTNGFAGLTMNGAGGITLTAAASVSGALTFTNGIITTGSNTLTVGSAGTISGGSSSTHVVGILQKLSIPTLSGTGPANTFTFPVGVAAIPLHAAGYTPLDLNNTTLGGDLTVTTNHAIEPALASYTSVLNEYWKLDEGNPVKGDLTFHYLQTDVTGTEANYQVFVVESGNPTSFPPDSNHSVDTTGNTFNIKQVQNFSNWTVAAPQAPTAVKLTGFTATENNGEVMLQWRTGYEARNLGYNIYREQDGQRTQITPSLVAGSALIAGRQAKLTAGLSYTWYDQPGGQGEGVKGNTSPVTYWLEDVDLDGTRTLHGPIAPLITYNQPQRGMMRADTISEVSQRTAPSGGQFNGWAGDGADRQSGPQAGMRVAGASASGPVIDPIDMQHQLAGMAGVKLAVGKAGWYRVTQAELQAAGFKVGNVGNLQLFRNGRELAIGVSGNGQGFGAGDYVEFYGAGLESATETAQSYYLVNGSTRGKRLSVTKGGKASAPAGPQSFAYTIERKERMIYFSSLRNGDTENFFGQIVSSTAVTAAMPVSHLEAATGGAQLQVVLQGVTSQSHLVQVLLNGTDLGTINFANLEHPNQTFAVPAGALHDGDNTVALSSLGGAADVSLVDVLRLTYTRSLVADNNTLSLGINSQQTRRITGFTNQNVRVLDITDPNNTTELTPVVKAEDGGYAAYVEVGQASGLAPHTLLALAAAGGPAASVKANNPSSWWSQAGGTGGADYLIVTTGELKASVEPLAQLRRNQGMVVQVIDVEDLYDEFSYGTHTPQAIHDLLQTATSSWTRKPHYVLLAGDASYDPKNYFGQGLNDLVPTKLLDTALMETASDDWLADFNGDGLADLALGRLPMRTAADLNTMVGKLVSYETAAVDPTRGAVLVADTSFEGSSSAVGSLLPSGMPVTTINRSSADDATIHNQIIAGLNQGPRVANYVGHGSNGVWTGASLLSSDDAPALTNTNRLSVFTMMTCFNGFFQDAYNDSLAEALLKSPGGAVAVWASTTLTDPEGQNVIDQEFYRLLFGAQPLTLGDASRAAKGATGDADVRRTWTLFGDPAMRLR